MSNQQMSREVQYTVCVPETHAHVQVCNYVNQQISRDVLYTVVLLETQNKERVRSATM